MEQEKARISTLAFRLTAKHAFDIVILEADQFGVSWHLTNQRMHGN